MRFDYRDILADTNEVEYGFVNRLFSKKTKLSPKCFQHPEYSKLFGKPDRERQRAAWASARTSASPRPVRSSAGRSRRNILATRPLAERWFPERATCSTAPSISPASPSSPNLAYFSPIISRLQRIGRTDRFPVGPGLRSGAAPGQCEHNLRRISLRQHWYLNGGQTYVNAPGEPAIINGVVIPNIYNQWRMGVIYGGMSTQGLQRGIQRRRRTHAPTCCRPRPSRPTTTGTAAALPSSIRAGLSVR